MNRPRVLSGAERSAIATKLGDYLRRVAGTENSHGGIFTGKERLNLHMAESIEIWSLANTGIGEIKTGIKRMRAHHRLIEFAENTCLWHHQLRTGKRRAVGFAETSGRSAGKRQFDWSVERLSVSARANQLDRALKVADVRGRRTRLRQARLLLIPGSHMVCLWLEEKSCDRLLVVEQPPGEYRLVSGRAYDWQDLFGKLAKKAQLRREDYDSAGASDNPRAPRSPPVPVRSAPPVVE